MKKIKLKNICFLLLGVIIGSVTIVYAAVIGANEVSYAPSDSTWEVSSVKEALDSLYSLKDNIKLELVGTNANNRSELTAEENTLTTDYSLTSGKYIVVVTGTTAIDTNTTIGDVVINLSQEATTINTITKENMVCDDTTSICSHASTTTSVFSVNITEDTTLSASYKSSNAKQQQILMQIFKF